MTHQNMTKPDRLRIRDILAKSLGLQTLDRSDVSALLALRDGDLWDEVYAAARRVKEKVYGRRIVLFAPLYLSNECANDCLYCGFRRGNSTARRKTLNTEETVEEAALLAARGYRRLLLVAGEHPRHAGIEYLKKTAGEIYRKTDIRILHVNAAPMSVKDFRRLKAAGFGVYQCFQETYHLPSYRRYHQSGAKADYQWRILAMDRAIEGGFEDVGMGVLLGLYDWRRDAAALIDHSLRLIEKYGFGPHTLSVPRLQAAPGACAGEERYRVTGEDLKKIVAIYRLALPYVGIVVSTREPAGLRDELLLLGASQISAGSKTSPGGYLSKNDTEQFEIGDSRSLEEVIGSIAGLGLIPSLCTACYREGRSGARFRELAEEAVIGNFCHENAVLSLSEYARHCAGPGVREQLKHLLREEVAHSRNGLADKVRLVESGTKDVHI